MTQGHTDKLEGPADQAADTETASTLSMAPLDYAQASSAQLDDLSGPDQPMKPAQARRTGCVR